jgi:hypothetical protein
MRNKVDFPQPDGPTKTRNSPGFTSSEMSWITFVMPYDLTALRTLTAVMI